MASISEVNLFQNRGLITLSEDIITVKRCHLIEKPCGRESFKNRISIFEIVREKYLWV
jgi:hypothetical protein